MLEINIDHIGRVLKGEKRGEVGWIQIVSANQSHDYISSESESRSGEKKWRAGGSENCSP